MTQIDIRELLNRKGIAVEFVSNNNLMIKCPFHAEGKERNPSMGVEQKTGMYNCFTCGAKGSVVSWMTDEEIATTQRVRELINFIRPEKVELPKIEIPKHDNKPTYTLSRGVSQEVINKFSVFEDDDSVYFPIRDRYGRVTDIGSRGKRNKVFGFLGLYENSRKPLYGEYECSPRSKVVVVTEGLYDVLVARSHFDSVVGLMGLGSDYQIDLLNSSRFRKIVLALDNDKYGIDATQRIANKINLVEVHAVDWNKLGAQYGNDFNDLGELNKEQLLFLIESAVEIAK